MIDHSDPAPSNANEDPGNDFGFLKPLYHFETSQFPVNEQFDRYRDKIHALGLIERSDGKGSSDVFFADDKGFALGGIHVLSMKSDSLSFARSARNVNAFGMDDWLLAVRVKGCVDADLDGHTIRFQGSRLQLRNMGEPFSEHFSNNESLNFFLPRKMLTGLEGILDNLSLTQKSQCLHPLLSHYLTALGSRLPRMTPAEALIAAETSLTMIRACISRSPDAVVAAETPILATRFEVARKFIESNLERPDLTAESVRTMLCVSRRQMYKVFEIRGGVERYIRARRLNACYKELQELEKPAAIRQVAEKYGFTNVANFGRQFRAEFGCSPGEVRETAGPVPALTSYTKWLCR